MKFESFGGNEEAIQEITEMETVAADPTTYSILPPEEINKKFLKPLSEFGQDVYTADGETYYKVNKAQNPRGQQAVARALKGILNVSDIVTIPNENGEDEFYSWKMPLKKIGETNSAEEVETDQMLFEQLFQANDHLFNKSSGWINNARYKDGKLAHFDFGEDTSNFLSDATEGSSAMSQLMYKSSTERANLGEKLSALRKRFEGEDGKAFLESITAASGVPITSLFGKEDDYDKQSETAPLDLVQQTLLERISRVQTELDNITATESESETLAA